MTIYLLRQTIIKIGHLILGTELGLGVREAALVTCGNSSLQLCCLDVEGFFLFFGSLMCVFVAR